MCPASPSAAARTMPSARTAPRWRSRCAPRAGEAWSTNFDIYEVAADGSDRRAISPPTTPPGTGSPRSRPTARSSPTSPWTGPASKPIGFIWCCSICKSGAKRPLTHNWDRSIVSFAWSRDGKTLFATADHLGQRPLWAIDASSGERPRPSPAPVKSRISASGPARYSIPPAISAIPPTCTRSDSPAASPRNSRT